MPKNYLTPTGFLRLKEERRELLSVERPKIVQAVNVAAAMGDRSENADYIYGKRRLREIDRRLRFLSGRLEDVEVIEPSTQSTEKVAFGVWVQVADESGIESWYQIVGEDEIDPKQGRITFSSPLGRALLGKKPGDLVKVNRPTGEAEMEILAIRNSAPADF